MVVAYSMVAIGKHTSLLLHLGLGKDKRRPCRVKGSSCNW